MTIVVINGNPKSGGFVAECLNCLAARLENRGASVLRIMLADQHIEECRGCFACLKTGICGHQDDIDELIRRLVEANGIVVGSPVRNASMTALYKRFYERIIYRLGFTLQLEDKQTLIVSSVGLAGGKAVNRRFLSLKEMGARTSEYLFFRVGIPAKTTVEDVRTRLEQAADRLLHDIDRNRPKSFITRLSAAMDRAVMRRFMLTRHPDFYANVIEHWRNKGYL